MVLLIHNNNSTVETSFWIWKLIMIWCFNSFFLIFNKFSAKRTIPATAKAKQPDATGRSKEDTKSRDQPLENRKNPSKVPLHKGSSVFISTKALLSIYTSKPALYTSRLIELMYGLETLQMAGTKQQSVGELGDPLDTLNSTILEAIISEYALLIDLLVFGCIISSVFTIVSHIICFSTRRPCVSKTEAKYFQKYCAQLHPQSTGLYTEPYKKQSIKLSNINNWAEF